MASGYASRIGAPLKIIGIKQSGLSSGTDRFLHAGPCGRRHRQANDKSCSSSFFGLKENLTLVLVHHDGTGNGQALPRSLPEFPGS
jgi:hypothetical protein